MRLLTIVPVLFLASCSRQVEPAPPLHHTQTLADGRTASLAINTAELLNGHGFIANIGDLPIVAAPESLKHLSQFVPLSAPSVAEAGPDLIISFTSGPSDKARFVELRVTHRFVQQITTIGADGERVSRAFAPAPMPAATIKLQTP